MEDCLDEDLRQRLRTATAPLHRRTEAAVAEHTPLTDRAGYARFLVAMRQVHQLFGAALARGSELAGCGESMVPRAQAAIAEDLRILGGEREPAHVPAGDRQLDDAAALGVLYVFEGSAHGAAVLHAQLGAHYGASAPLSYFGLLREHGPQRWPRVLAALQSQVATGAPQRVLAGAQSAFAEILTAVSRRRPAQQEGCSE